MTGWTEFAEGLAEELADLPAGAVVKIVEPGPAPRYAQFRQLDDELWAELVGDHWLAPAARAGSTGGRLIVEAGWHAPDADHGHNWWVEWPWPQSSARYRQLTSMVVTGLRDGFGIAAVSDLSYVAWNENVGNCALDLPGLGLPRHS
ncbi:hypothetical protein GV794_17255 [Nocardia cyriacigeorgica]|uniref:TY-Chap N-terminal domain-containing protein n=1 Tax=Nocardia cyriacigeorgica TaxID=135487 RepID=A0A6P1DD42_9NOCA|nr:hypothetical protein [Nocardia cyriacigeorgica]NEW39046.1 hypothetical protein [Nocardia cyriacigeorgica]NEW47521.1 hypothetical protein [Nocardia cyriacigeorgica]NEW52682.1 hypothetical protein [Nocardia cyriacigeorgica]NEW57389.1 hypothetical protein [Nocardia cyriacigeorgica]